jgi:hypothetical protein
LNGRLSDAADNVVRNHTDELLSDLLWTLSPGGLLTVQEPLSAVQSDLESRFRLAGFVDVVCTRGDASYTIKAKKPDWEEGAAFKLVKKTGVAFPAKNAWKLDDKDLIEDDLIAEEELVLDDVQTVLPGSLPIASGAQDECGPSKKACKNCVCGRAEEEAKGDKQSQEKSLLEKGIAEVKDGKLVVDTGKMGQGGCGSCSLGDAFRCAGCPSRGLPAYSVGQKVVLDL